MAIEVALDTLETNQGMVPYLDIYRTGTAGRRENKITIKDIYHTAQAICQKCPLLSNCEPEHKLRTLTGIPVGVVVVGNKIDLEECLLRSRGLSAEDILRG